MSGSLESLLSFAQSTDGRLGLKLGLSLVVGAFCSSRRDWRGR